MSMAFYGGSFSVRSRKTARRGIALSLIGLKKLEVAEHRDSSRAENLTDYI